ncbi:succinate dehydrogenase cytochrome b560 subunit, mitochondrial-like [Euroglyphus maynei]|uniref:Succinate dehydrogenase cytochrome b560 subunit, mitochondrial-like n=1 Tax=Euroglyphus maynei TaxID=6958 RepID=A0A1Y3B765_EURMA|nr:succinate dehydrogenase cytochrome b560 subunit, mitochondrial-like [Euroglyphus maynei]
MLITRIVALYPRGQSKNIVTKIGQQIRNDSTFTKEAEKFMAKHAKRGSPQSPYMLGLTYKIQLTSMLSLTHRFTGVGLGLIIYGFGIAELLYSNKNFSQLLESYSAVIPCKSIFKIMCGTALAYHTFNGVRHLCWDMGYGYSIPRLYLTGYAVLGKFIQKFESKTFQSKFIISQTGLTALCMVALVMANKQ